MSSLLSLFTTIVGFVFLNDVINTAEKGTFLSQIQKNGRGQGYGAHECPTGLLT